MHMMVNKNLVIGVLVAIIAGGVGFFGGSKYQQSKSLASFANRQGTFRFGMGQSSGRMGANNFRPVTGEVISQDDKSITVKMMDGSTKIVLLSDSTTYSNTVSATKTDVEVGGTVAVLGATNSDGSVTATNVSLNPMFRMTPSPAPSK